MIFLPRGVPDCLAPHPDVEIEPARIRGSGPGCILSLADRPALAVAEAALPHACHRGTGFLLWTCMQFEAVPCSPDAMLPLRERYRAEMNCQLIYYEIHARAGWTEMFALHVEGELAGFGTKAIAGPWRDRPTILEFFVVPERRTHVFKLFETLLARTGARHIETQSNGTLLAHMLHTWSRDAVTESILFEDKIATDLPANGATLRQVTPDAAIRSAIEERGGGGDWQLVVDSAVVGQGGILFHYNRPYGDLHMEITEAFRQRGYGAYLVQELKRVCRGIGAIPAARCNPDNLASRYTLQKAGFVPCGHMLTGSILM
jgi:GNAT superfamily N-acetyltransferase